MSKQEKMQANVKSVLQLVAEHGLSGDAEIRCSIKGRHVDDKATVKLATHSLASSYHTYVSHLEIEFDDAYIDHLVSIRVAAIFAKLAADACAKP